MNHWIDFLKKSNDKLLIISDNKDVIQNLNEQNTIFVLIDDLSCITYITLEYLFSQNKVVIFINDKTDLKKFNDIVLDKLVRYFDNNDSINDCLVFSSYNFPYKKSLSRISQFVRGSSFEVSNTQNILYLGQSGTSGYATAAKGYICDYFLKNNNVTWKPLYFDNSKNDSQYYVDILAESCINKSFDYYDTFFLHCTPDIWKREINIHKKLDIKKTIGYCTWETNSLPKKWVQYINQLEEVWVPSQFNKETFINSGVRSKIKVVPHVWHEQKLFNKKDVKLVDFFGNIIPHDKYTFYSIGELNNRKGIDDIIKVFNHIQQIKPDCQLLLKLHYKQYGDKNYYKCIKQIKQLTDSLGKSIYIILDNLTNREILMLHSFGDCYVSLNKGEGFGLTIFDAWNYGKDIVATKYGGPLDYITNRRQLVACDLKPVENMESFSNQYTSEQMWAHPNLDCAYEIMLAKVS